eukprot:1275682-Alexandrium_andersonii.AAC.1
MSASLVGSEMCIRDRHSAAARAPLWRAVPRAALCESANTQIPKLSRNPCLLYTSDAADDM